MAMPVWRCHARRAKAVRCAGQQHQADTSDQAGNAFVQLQSSKGCVSGNECSGACGVVGHAWALHAQRKRDPAGRD
eukprot:scaffold250610_cov30-Tisochrysis_lutea.AAC.17